MWNLLFANLKRKRLRFALTFASITLAFLLFALVQALQHALTGGVELAGQDRLMTMDKVSMISLLPRSYLERIRSTEGVRSATAYNWFGGYYQDERTQVFSYPVLGEESLFEVYPEIIVPDAQKKIWLNERNGALIGKSLANAHGWKVGDHIPLRSAIFFKKDGSNTWNLTVSAIFDWHDETGDTNGLYFHYDYFNEALDARSRDRIGWIGLRLKNKDQATSVAATIDKLFANSPNETKTDTEKAFTQGFINQLGNIGTIISVIVAAVFFTMLLVTANTMSQSVRERTNEIAVMKTLGFSGLSMMSLVLAESLLVTFMGGILGLTLGTFIAQGIGTALKQFLPLMRVPTEAYISGVFFMLLLGVLAGALPCWYAWRLKITDALRRS